jgi:hypothetical protein
VCSSNIAGNGLRLGVVADFQHKCSFEKLHLNLPLNCHTEHCTRHYAKPSNSRFDQKGLENEGNGIFVKKLNGKTRKA